MILWQSHGPARCRSCAGLGGDQHSRLEWCLQLWGLQDWWCCEDSGTSCSQSISQFVTWQISKVSQAVL